MKYYIQETIGGWRQNAIYSGSLKDCEKFIKENSLNGSFSIVDENEYEVDYI